MVVAERLVSRSALVTGGASGLGAAIAHRLATEGAHVFITDVDVDSGGALAEARGYTFILHDVTDEGGWNQIVAEVETTAGRFDVLVNNAGILGSRNSPDPEHAQLTDWRHVFAVNVEGVFLGCRAAIPAMRRAGGGSIINISSIAGLLAAPHAPAYGASKAAVHHLTTSVAQYCAKQGLNIRCNSVHPGNVRTPAWEEQARSAAAERGVSFKAVLAEAEACVPLGGFTDAADVAAAVAFLASEDARHITGTKLVVDGGVVGCSTFHFEASMRCLSDPDHRDREP